MCGVCAKLGINIHQTADLVSADPEHFSLDPYVGSTFRGKVILDQAGIINQIDSGNSLKVTNGVITYTFLDKSHLTGLYNNPNLGFEAGYGLAPFTADQRDAARDAIRLWDDLIPQTFKETNGMGADIQFSNSQDPAQAYAYYPGKQGWKFQSDVFIADPEVNWSNAWFTPGGYANTTLIHEIGHSVGLSHPGAYNGAGATTYLDQAEYAQDSTQYSIMSYWSGGQTGNRVVEWTTFFFSNPQSPMLHDILTIQAKYGADPTTRTGNTTYGFNSTAGIPDIFNFNLNPFPYLSVYDAGGTDTIDLSGFTGSQFLDLHAGSFSSIGQGILAASVVNAARAEFDEIYPLTLAPLSQATISGVMNNYMNTHANWIALDTGVTGIRASEYDNFSIAYGVTIENAIGGSARDLLWGNDVANVLEGRGGNDVIRGFGGNDTLIGGTGADTLQGDAGIDKFVFNEVGLGDVINDYAAGETIDLRGTGVDFTFIGNAAFSNVAGQLRYDGGFIQGDVNGDGLADLSIQLIGSPTLGAGDLLFG